MSREPGKFWIVKNHEKTADDHQVDEGRSEKDIHSKSNNTGFYISVGLLFIIIVFFAIGYIIFT